MYGCGDRRLCWTPDAWLTVLISLHLCQGNHDAHGITIPFETVKWISPKRRSKGLALASMLFVWAAPLLGHISESQDGYKPSRTGCLSSIVTIGQRRCQKQNAISQIRVQTLIISSRAPSDRKARALPQERTCIPRSACRDSRIKQPDSPSTLWRSFQVRLWRGFSHGF